MLNVERLIVGQMSTNCYLAYEDKTEEGVIIDPGDDPDYIVNKIRGLEIKPVAIIATHGHFDHILGVNELKLAFNIPFLVSVKDKFLLERMRSSSKHFLGYDPGPAPKIDKGLRDTMNVKVGNEKLNVILTPGHTPGSVTLYNKERSLAFVGDTLFANGGLGRVDFDYSDEGELKSSVSKILSFEDDTLLLPGHGDETFTQKERTYQEKPDFLA